MTKYAFILLVCLYSSCLVTCLPLPHLPILNPLGSWSRALCSRSPWSLPHQPADQPRDAWCNSLYHAGPSITDPMVRDKVLSCRKGWQINFNSDWWAMMQLSWLVWGQHHEVEKLVSKNRSRDLQWGDSGTSVIMSRVKLCLGQSREGHSIR